ETEQLAQLVAIQARIGWPARRGRIGRRRDPRDIGHRQTVLGGLPKNLAGKAKPTCLASGNRVIGAPAKGAVLVYDASSETYDRAGQIWNVGWRTQLILDNTDDWPCRCHPLHLFEEISPLRDV